MSNRFHNKLHRHNHHTNPTDRTGLYPDSAYDPIASPEAPFKGEFYVDGSITSLSSISALGDIFSTNGVFSNNLTVSGFIITNSSVSSNNAIYALGGDSNQWNTSFSTVHSNSAIWDYQGTDLKGLSADWQNTYSEYSSNSASYATISYSNSKFFPLTGGIVLGATRINGNVTIYGDLSSSGTQTFANTVFSTTSALSVINVGSGPALIVSQTGTGDIASFYDTDYSLEVLHVGGQNSSFPNVGIKVSSPNKDFTVKGEISASGVIWDPAGNSNQWNSAYTTVGSNSATAWNYQGSDLKALSSNWQSAYTTVGIMSASWQTLTTNATVSAFVNPVTATGSFLILNINGTNKALMLWDFTS